ncbi:hypothetical protein P154DRAFT_582560 [Amniculicola lignicola CBS 123094]|uniref:Uncharacterized protein n=1 Tax=Amniculicola lignicola CBS 123094 TaxID=1392246 RepID=A0A6A5VXE6_9PLEO|nr:hypothetical protein P154DRAFT_582560 [Amniculicola lignicola CBS 123094]
MGAETFWLAAAFFIWWYCFEEIEKGAIQERLEDLEKGFGAVRKSNANLTKENEDIKARAKEHNDTMSTLTYFLNNLTGKVESLTREATSLTNAPVHSHENVERRIVASLPTDEHFNKAVRDYVNAVVKKETTELTNTINGLQNRIQTLEIEKTVQLPAHSNSAILAAHEGAVWKGFDSHKNQVTKKLKKVDQEIATLKQKSLPTLEEIKTEICNITIEQLKNELPDRFHDITIRIEKLEHTKPKKVRKDPRVNDLVSRVAILSTSDLTYSARIKALEDNKVEISSVQNGPEVVSLIQRVDKLEKTPVLVISEDRIEKVERDLDKLFNIREEDLDYERRCMKTVRDHDFTVLEIPDLFKYFENEQSYSVYWLFAEMLKVLDAFLLGQDARIVALEGVQPD